MTKVRPKDLTANGLADLSDDDLLDSLPGKKLEWQVRVQTTHGDVTSSQEATVHSGSLAVEGGVLHFREPSGQFRVVTATAVTRVR